MFQSQSTRKKGSQFVIKKHVSMNFQSHPTRRQDGVVRCVNLDSGGVWQVHMWTGRDCKSQTWRGPAIGETACKREELWKKFCIHIWYTPRWLILTFLENSECIKTVQKKGFYIKWTYRQGSENNKYQIIHSHNDLVEDWEAKWNARQFRGYMGFSCAEQDIKDSWSRKPAASLHFYHHRKCLHRR